MTFLPGNKQTLDRSTMFYSGVGQDTEPEEQVELDLIRTEFRISICRGVCGKSQKVENIEEQVPVSREILLSHRLVFANML